MILFGSPPVARSHTLIQPFSPSSSPCDSTRATCLLQPVTILPCPRGALWVACAKRCGRSGPANAGSLLEAMKAGQANRDERCINQCILDHGGKVYCHQ
jgi:hypothetical protein